MGIGLEQNSETAFAEFALGNVQLTLNPDNEPVPLEGKAYYAMVPSRQPPTLGCPSFLPFCCAISTQFFPFVYQVFFQRLEL